MSRGHLDHKIVDRTKVRDGQVANRPIYVALAVTTEGRREFLGIWAGDGGEGAKHWLQVFTELKNRGVEDVLMLVCDGLKGPPDAVETIWWAWTSPVVRPFAASEMTISSTPVRRFCRFLTIFGSNEPSRSRGTVISTGPTSEVSTVLERLPLRELPPSLPDGSCLS